MKQIRETSDFVVGKIYDQIEHEMISDKCFEDSFKVLEPSCGEGKLLENIDDVLHSKIELTCIELNSERLEKAKENIDVNIKYGVVRKVNYIKGDFLIEADKLNEKYSLILACPPFKNNVDLLHIQKMYDLLDEYSQLITLTSPLWITNNEVHQVQFRKWLEDKKYTLTMLPDNSFMEKGKSVPTAILRIER